LWRGSAERAYIHTYVHRLYVPHVESETAEHNGHKHRLWSQTDGFQSSASRFITCLCLSFPTCKMGLKIAYALQD
jgi:hypothetical protein